MITQKDLEKAANEHEALQLGRQESMVAHASLFRDVEGGTPDRSGCCKENYGNLLPDFHLSEQNTPAINQPEIVRVASTKSPAWVNDSINTGFVEWLTTPTWVKRPMNSGLVNRLKGN